MYVDKTKVKDLETKLLTLPVISCITLVTIPYYVLLRIK